MILKDDRTEQQKQTHVLGVRMTYRLLSEWGMAAYVVWACKPEHVNSVGRWVRSRGDAMRVCVVTLRNYRPRGHCHVYVVDEGHVALRMERVCLRCGCGRTTNTWAQDPEDGEQGLTSTSYEVGRYASELEQ